MRGLRGKTLQHHHIAGGMQVVGIPAPLHHGFGGVHNVEKLAGIWDVQRPFAKKLDELISELLGE